jgi:hypothetical protein
MDVHASPAELPELEVDDLAQHFHTPRAAVLSYIMQWALSHGQTGPLDQYDAQGPVRHLYLYVEAGLHDQVQKAAAAAGVKIAPWLRHMVRQITIPDFPASWKEERPAGRSYDSHVYTERFMLRLDELSKTKLQHLVEHYGASKANIIRQLIAQAETEDFPPSWQKRADACGARQARQESPHADQEPRS